ncbi:rhamnogalacturonase B, partial [Ephemerocybe angulata]
MRLHSFLVCLQALLFANVAHAAFGLTESGNSLIADTNAGLVFTVDKTNGDVTSMKFNGIEVQDQGGKKSHIGSGLGASCSWVRTGNANNYIKITCNAGTLTQYYVARYNDPAIHMATYISAEPDIGELRFIARLRRAAVPNGYTASNIEGGTAIEGSDVYYVNGQTRSKFYSSRQFIDDQIHGVTGSGVGVWMIIPDTGYESSSGGPFMRDINNQGGTQQELYYYKNSGHTQTESNRMGLHGPYALFFTSGSQPSTDINTVFWDGLGITGFVSQTGRGRVTGTASGVPSSYSNLQVIGLSNSAAQYWTRAASNGRFTSPYMKPGTYTMTLYKAELAVASQSVSVTAGGTLTSNIASKEDTQSAIWQIGEFDGTPRGFLNADKIETMHPSDSRMRSWGPVTFTVGNSIDSFPLAAFKAIGAVTIKFNLSSSQIGARTLEIGTTLAFAGGRPQVKVNNWSGPNPAAPSQPNSRGITRGTWRGNNIRYTVNIPSGTLVAGSNTLVINVLSGSSGDNFLSPNFVFDALRLY